MNLRGSVYDLRTQDKALRVTLCSYSLDNFTIQNTHIYRRIDTDKYSTIKIEYNQLDKI
jgi:hypothetical protein